MSYLLGGLSTGIFIFLGILAGLSAFLLIATGLTHEVAFRKCGSERSFLAWIPLANYYELSVITRDENDNNSFFGLKIPHKYFRFWIVLAFVVMAIPVIGKIAYIVIMIGCLGGCYQRLYAMLENTNTKETTLMAYLSAFISLVAVIKLFKYIGNDKPSLYNTAKYEVKQMPNQNYQQMPNQNYQQMPNQNRQQDTQIQNANSDISDNLF